VNLDARATARPATQPRSTATVAGLVAVMVAIVSFSISTPVIKWSGETGSVIAFWRMVLAVGAWWAVLAVRRLRWDRPFPTARTWRLVLPPALFFGANIATLFTAVTRTSIAHAEFIGTLSPLVLLPAGAVFFGEHPNWGALRFGALSIVGVAFVLFFGPASGTAHVSGDLLMVLVVALWTSYLLTSKRARAAGVDTVDFMACLMPLGLLTAGPIALVIAGRDILGLGPRGWFVVVVLTLLTGMLAHGCIFFAQRLVPVATIGVMQTSQPALAVLWAFLILGETVLPLQIVGMAMVVVGLSMFTWVSQAPARRVRAAAIADATRSTTGPRGR
jgi:drug/metabolite transporter (DMT)-like permease